MQYPNNPETIPSPALLIFPEQVEQNIAHMVDIVGGKPERLRPHIKTHKLGEIVKMQLAHGITKTKCATIAEMEMCAEADSPDVMMAYPPIGPNIARLLKLTELFPSVKFSAVCDSDEAAKAIAAEFSTVGKSLPLCIDINPGMNRTGILPGPEAIELVKQIVATEGIEFAGVHAYDGHIHDAELEVRIRRFAESFDPIFAFIDELKEAGIETKALVTGGSPTMALHAEKAAEMPFSYECSAGTPTLWDTGYEDAFPELGFVWAAALLTRVISKPGTPDENLICVDLGHKAVAAEMSLDMRVRFPSLPDAEFLGQSEEHLVIKTEVASSLTIGDVLYGIPRHICPTVALHQEVVIVRDGAATGERWEIKARDRRLTV